MGVAVYLTHTIVILCIAHCHPLKLAAVSKKKMPISRYLFGESSLQIRQLSSGMLSINTLAVNCVLFWMSKIFDEMVS